MLGALLLGLARRMQRVGEQEEGGNWLGVFCGLGAEHAGLASAIGVAAEEEAAGNYFFQGGERVLQAGAVAGGVAGAGRAEGSRLAIGEIAAQDGESGGGESFGEGDEQRGLRVGTGAVGEDEGVSVG